MHIITIEKRSNGYIAYLDGDRKRRGSGKTKYVAIAELVCAYKDDLGINIEEVFNVIPSPSQKI